MGLRSYGALAQSKEWRPGGVRVCHLLRSSVMRRIKLSGRERAVLKALGFAEAIPGEQIRDTRKCSWTI